MIYEPNPLFAQHSRETLLLNNVNGVVHELFVNCSSSHSSISWSDVLQEKIHIAKVDCEGCENGLLSMADETLRKIPNWVIECHDSQTLRWLGEKFLRAGFRVTFKIYLRKSGYTILDREKPFHIETRIPNVPSDTMVVTYILIARLTSYKK